MNTSLPHGLLSWLSQHDWLAIHSRKLTGGYAATLYRLLVLTADGEELDCIYKRFAPNRAQESHLYKSLLPNLREYAPKVYGYINEKEEQGIVVDYAGQPVKSVLSRLNHTDQQKLLTSTALWLADMHTRHEADIPHMVQRGLPGRYPLQSSVAWAQNALTELAWLSHNNTAGLVAAPTLRGLEVMFEQFYPHYETWLNGRSTLTHGDPHLENIMTSNDGLRLIDWEAACVAVPQRDLAVLLQDILDGELHHAVRRAYFDHLQKHGWEVATRQFQASFQACLFDNTLMMLGWEIHKFREGHLMPLELEAIVTTKLDWLRTSFANLL